MKTTKVNLTRTDKFTLYLRTKEYCDETFGEEYIKEYGVDIPSELVERYKKVYNEYMKIQEELKKYHE